MLQKNRVRSSRVVRWLATLGGVAGVVVACVQLKGSLGSDCLKNEDCQSGVCVQLHCAEQPPVLELEAGPDAAADGTADAPPGTGTDGPVTMKTDAISPGDAPSSDVLVAPGDSTAPLDAPADAFEGGLTPDAPSDAPADAAVDVRVDAAESG